MLLSKAPSDGLNGPTVRETMKKPPSAHKPKQNAARAFRFDLATFVPYRVSILATLIRRALSEIYRDDPGLTEPEWKVLTTVAHEGPLPSGDIGLHMTLDRMSISRALTQLIKLKLVERSPFAQDRRMTQVKLSAHGERVFDALAREAAKIEEDILSPLSRAEIAEFLRTIDKIEKNFRTHGSSRRPALIQTATAMAKRRTKK